MTCPPASLSTKSIIFNYLINLIDDAGPPEHIVAVDEYRHLASAAGSCFVTRPTLSMQIQKLTELVMYNEEFVAYPGHDHPLLQVNTIDPFLRDTDEVWVLDEGHCFRAQGLNICQNPGVDTPVRV